MCLQSMCLSDSTVRDILKIRTVIIGGGNRLSTNALNPSSTTEPITVDTTASEPAAPDAMQEEQTRLSAVLESMNRQIEHLDSMPVQFADDDAEPQTADEVAQMTVERLRAEHLRTIRGARSEPYFGRLDFEESGAGPKMPLYIGKRGIEDDASGDRLVIDWRAPIASLFYSFTGQGDAASYESPDGVIEGHVDLKRNIVIRDAILQRVVDSYVRGQENLSVTDEFLLYRLSEQKDRRLRDIVSSIQAEQDRIIRAKRNLAIVIQGVAGSGKTTVALHRLAYLLYQYQEKLRAERMIIFAPNAMFLDYISDVLPELGVGGIRQTTFHTWALDLLGDRVRLNDPSRRLTRWFSKSEDADVARERTVAKAKGTLAFAAALDEQIHACETTLLPQADFSPWDGATLPAATIRSWWMTDYRHLPLAERRERVLARVKRWYEIELKNVSEDVDRARLRKTASQRYRAYSGKWGELSVIDLYNAVLGGAGLPTIADAAYGSRGAAGQRRKPAKAAKRPAVEQEDLAPLLYLHTRLTGVAANERFDHVVIDEAQDFSPLQIELLKAYCPSCSFTILGDLAQSIHTYQGIADWNAFLDLFTDEESAYFQLDVSYRSTTEIIEFANSVVAKFEGFLQAQPVFRSGDSVVVERAEGTTRHQRAVAAVQEMRQTANTVAVICRTEADCDAYHAALQGAGVAANLIGHAQQRYSGGVSVLPVYLAKGLEFDAVLLVDVDADGYDDTPRSARLLYVGCTRALHQLRLQHAGARSPLLD